MTTAQLLRRMRSVLTYPYYRECLRGVTERKYPVFINYPINPRPRYGHGKPPHVLLYDQFDAEHFKFRSLLESFQNFESELLAIPEHYEVESLNPFWNNGYFPALDAIALYCLLATHNPAHFIEIGSGNSTKFARRAIRDNALQTEITSIDPVPRTKIDALADKVIRQPLEDLDLGLFGQLHAGDVVFFDGSHRTFMNSDVTVFFLEILPALPTNVLVHIHDIYLPNDYPPNRVAHYESEQYLLAAMLLGRCTRYDTLLPNNFVEQDRDLSGRLDWFWRAKPGVERWGSSFWLRLAA